MNNKLIGGILFIVGTSIGGGMLALPIATAQLGFFNTLFLLIICWALMTISALLLLEVNLWHSTNSHLITMAKTTLGPLGEIISWACYLLLLNTLLAAYISGGGDFLRHFLSGFHIKTTNNISIFLFTFLLSLVIYKGIWLTDFINRGLMFGKLTITALLVICIFPLISPNYLCASTKISDLPITSIITSITVVITSFGFAIIVPSLRNYFQNNIKQLRKAILIGSFIPLICYISWELVIVGVIPSHGYPSLTYMLHSGHSNNELINTLSQLLHNPLINFLATSFTALCLATSFLGVALSLFDFLKDAFTLKKNKVNKLVIYIFSFLPPIIIATHYPNVFVTGLSYAGIFCIILLVILPCMMVWSGRYLKNFAKGYRVFGGKFLLFTLIIISFLLVTLNLINYLT